MLVRYFVALDAQDFLCEVNKTSQVYKVRSQGKNCRNRIFSNCVDIGNEDSGNLAEQETRRLFVVGEKPQH